MSSSDGDITPEPVDSELLANALALYRRGWFPMGDADGEVTWYRSRRRGIVPLDERFHVGRTLSRRLRKRPFVLLTDTAFGEVIRECANVPRAGETGTWLHPEIISLFDLFHRGGHAHSVEAWIDEPGGEKRLVGGVYGVAIGGVFCAESMYCRPDLGGSDAGKIALVELVGLLRRVGFSVLDAQIINEHTERFGAYEISDAAYRTLLERHAGRQPPPWPSPGPATGGWTASPT
ncbi:MAG: leucyl/phenylalanyl-tRNA--protein transferase [Phycisphaerae bacterium]|jgi:leucyl/phenylalanyl-tRNA--protein transferase